MNIIICLDKNNGMLFNGRRQSQDSVLREKIIELCADSKLWMNNYSCQQFSEKNNIFVSENFLNEAAQGDFCFIENVELPSPDSIEKIIVFNWNRHYPADQYFTLNLHQNGFKCEKKDEFVGSSHKKIKLEIYKRV